MIIRVATCTALTIAILAFVHGAEATTITLQSGAADISQSDDFHPNRAIDGEQTGTKGASGASWNGWAHNAGGTSGNTVPHTAVWETATDIDGPGDLRYGVF